MSHPRTIISPLALVGKISLAISLIAVLGLWLVFEYIGIDTQSASYTEMIESLTKARKSLFLVLVVSGLLIVSLCGLMTWVIGIYSTHRVAGPLYQFATNVHMELEQLTPPRVVVRSTDSLQKEAEDLEKTFIQVNTHYLRMGIRLKQIMTRLANREDSEGESLEELVEHFLSEEGRVRLEK